MTDKQKDLIEWMNEFCREKFDLSAPHTVAEASKYISENMDEYKLATMSSWILEKGYF